MPFRSSDRYAFWTTNWRPVGAVYGILDLVGNMIYVGRTDNLERRMGEHRCDSGHRMHRYMPQFVVVETIPTEAERCRRERQLIAEYNPPGNLI